MKTREKKQEIETQETQRITPNNTGKQQQTRNPQHNNKEQKENTITNKNKKPQKQKQENTIRTTQ